MSCIVYILYSGSSDKYYKGQTTNLEERLFRHNNGYEKSTKGGSHWELVWYAEKPDRSSAMILEKKLKNLSRKKLVEFIKKNNQIAGH